MTKVSACIITYNQESFIAKCIEGALIQNLSDDYEIIIGDDCSSDNTSLICQTYASRYPELITYIRREVNLGMIGNWTETISHCKGKYIALCEGDDYWTDPYKLQKQVEFLEANPDYVLCFHSVKYLQPDGSIVDDYVIKVPENYQTKETLAEKGNYIHTPSVMFKNIITSFPDEFYLSPVGDFFLYILLAQHGKIGKLEDMMAIYRHQTGIWSTLDIKAMRLNWFFTLMLISNVTLLDSKIKEIIDRRIKQSAFQLLSGLSSFDLPYLRANIKTAELTDELLIQALNYYKQNQVSNTPSKELVKIILNRIVRRFKLK
jgi:glycosyltransferase involved in cell wall biosynthesis